MPATDPPGDAAGPRIPEDLVEAGVYRTAEEGFDHGLAVLALGSPYWLVPGEAGFRLLVEPDALRAVRVELAEFDRESLGWPPKSEGDASPARGGDFATPLLWATVVYAVFFCQGLWPGRLEDAGALDARAVFGRGECWRPFTALFLHANFGHLISNLVSGYFTFVAVVSTVGRMRGWLLLVLASVTGNLAIAAAHYPGDYSSIGASTAIFAGLGLMTGRAIRLVPRSDRPHPWRAVFVPLAAGITLLGLFGAGGVDVDAGAHLTGFLAGLAWGFAAAVPRQEPARP
jgi:membrane associated rhomboid family serine protease